MKDKKQNLRTALGITQGEMAALLGVTRSQYSMYELGLRNLPHEASMRHSEMSVHLHAPGAQQSIQRFHAKRAPVSRKHIEKLLADNHIRQLRLERHIGAMREKRESALRRAHVSEFAATKKGVAREAINYVSLGTEKNFGQSASEQFFDCELKLKMLVYEQELLEEALEKAGA